MAMYVRPFECYVFSKQNWRPIHDEFDWIISQTSSNKLDMHPETPLCRPSSSVHATMHAPLQAPCATNSATKHFVLVSDSDMQAVTETPYQKTQLEIQLGL